MSLSIVIYLLLSKLDESEINLTHLILSGLGGGLLGSLIHKTIKV